MLFCSKSPVLRSEKLTAIIVVPYYESGHPGSRGLHERAVPCLHRRQKHRRGYPPSRLRSSGTRMAAVGNASRPGVACCTACTTHSVASRYVEMWRSRKISVAKGYHSWTMVSVKTRGKCEHVTIETVAILYFVLRKSTKDSEDNTGVETLLPTRRTFSFTPHVHARIDCRSLVPYCSRLICGFSPTYFPRTNTTFGV